MNDIFDELNQRLATRWGADPMVGAIAYALTRRLVIDMPTARAAVDEAIRDARAALAQSSEEKPFPLQIGMAGKWDGRDHSFAGRIASVFFKLGEDTQSGLRVVLQDERRALHVYDPNAPSFKLGELKP